MQNMISRTGLVLAFFSLFGQAAALFCLLAIPALLIGSYDEIAFRKNVFEDSPLYQLLWTFDLGSKALWLLDIAATTIFVLVGLSQLRALPKASDGTDREPSTQ
jgi:hypothetical protein